VRPSHLSTALPSSVVRRPVPRAHHPLNLFIVNTARPLLYCYREAYRLAYRGLHSRRQHSMCRDEVEVKRGGVEGEVRGCAARMGGEGGAHTDSPLPPTYHIRVRAVQCT